MITFLFNYAHWVILGVAGLLLSKSYKNFKLSVGIVLVAFMLLVVNQTLVFQAKPKAPVKQARHIPTVPVEVDISDKSLKPKLDSEQRQERVDSILDFRRQTEEILSK